MRAVIYERRGEARDVLQFADIAAPEPAAGEVRVRIAISAVNPTDTKARTDKFGQSAMPAPRVIPHRDGSGIIDKVGEGVDPARIGERVWVSVLDRPNPSGTAAEYAAVPAHFAWRLPRNVSFAEGAALPIPVLTAWCALFRDGPIAGKTVLVTGGAGAVGNYAVQLARRGGAGKVIATVSRDEQAAKAREAGAHEVVNYRSADAQLQLEQAAGGAARIDHIVEVNFAANIALDAAVIANNGSIVSYGSDAGPNPNVPFAALMQKDVSMRAAILYAMPRDLLARAAQDIISALEKGELKHQIATRMPLERIVEAHEMQESGRTIGKILLDVAALD